MLTSLDSAPLGVPLLIEKFKESNLALRLKRMGLFEGSEIMRQEQEILLKPVRVKGTKGDAVLGGGMAMKTIVHLDDGRRIPLAEMEPGDEGHIEGVTGATPLAEALAALGFSEDERVEMVRELPPMEYITVIQGQGRVRLTETMAAKIWGRTENRETQFVSASSQESFTVEKILGGKNAVNAVSQQGITPGKILLLEGVAQAQNLNPAVRNPIIISSKDGLRLFLSHGAASNILVTVLDG